MILVLNKNPDDCQRKDPEFRINGIEATWKDFGKIEADIPKDQTEDDFYSDWAFCCNPEKFVPKVYSFDVLEKYGINADEYRDICLKLYDILSFDGCAWCQ